MMKVLKAIGRFFLKTVLFIVILALFICICSLIPNLFLAPKDTVFSVIGNSYVLVFVFLFVLLCILMLYKQSLPFLKKHRTVYEDKIPNYDTYMEIELFDKSLMSLHIPKTASVDRADLCTLDAVYKERFLRIIRNT